MDIETVKLRLYQGLSEDLRKWFKDGGWNRYNTKGEKVGKCARDDKDGDGKADGPKPKCLPASKAASLGKKKVAAAVKRKRSEDPNPNRTGAAKNVNTESIEHIKEFVGTAIAGTARQNEEVEVDEAVVTGTVAAGLGAKKGMKEEVTFQSFNEKAQKCWDTHKKVGMKMKGGKLVNDCRPKNEEVEVKEATYPSDFKKGSPVATKKKGRPVQHDQAMSGGRRKTVDEGAAWTKKSGKSESGGLNEKGRKSYERENPGSDLKAPSKKKGNKRRASFCARMKGMRKRQKPSNNTGEDRLSKSLRAWDC